METDEPKIVLVGKGERICPHCLDVTPHQHHIERTCSVLLKSQGYALSEVRSLCPDCRQHSLYQKDAHGVCSHCGYDDPRMEQTS